MLWRVQSKITTEQWRCPGDASSLRDLCTSFIAWEWGGSWVGASIFAQYQQHQMKHLIEPLPQLLTQQPLIIVPNENRKTTKSLPATYILNITSSTWTMSSLGRPMIDIQGGWRIFGKQHLVYAFLKGGILTQLAN